MVNLLARLNTLTSLNKATVDEKKYGAGIYVDFGDESEIYKGGTFKKVIDSIIEQALDSEDESYRNIAGDIQNYFNEQGSGKIIEVLVYDPKTDDFLRNVHDEESKYIGLEETVQDYIVCRDIEGDTADYLDMVVRQKSTIGGI